MIFHLQQVLESDVKQIPKTYQNKTFTIIVFSFACTNPQKRWISYRTFNLALLEFDVIQYMEYIYMNVYSMHEYAILVGGNRNACYWCHNSVILHWFAAAKRGEVPKLKCARVAHCEVFKVPF